MSTHRFLDQGYQLREEVGPDMALLHYAEGRPAFEHVCKRWPDEQEPDGEFVKVVAPRLHPDHVVTRPVPRFPGSFSQEGGTTVRASILCPDCGLHGFITEGRWAS